MNTRLLPIVRKEFIHIVRDPRTLAIMFLIPVVQLILLGYAATTDIKHLATAVLDADRTPQSRQLIEAYRASGYFTITFHTQNEEDLARLIDGGQAKAGLIITPGFGDDLARGRPAQVGFIIDGSDPSVATTAFAAAQSVGQAHGIKTVQSRLGVDLTSLGGLDVRPRVWYNPEMRSANFMIPAIIGMILQFLLALFTALAIVREREQGTIEQLVVTPVQPWELVVGKVIPYIGIAFFDLTEVLLVGVFWFGVPIRGSVPLLLALSLLFILGSLGIGLFISTVAKSQMEAMFLAFLTMLPTIFLSGFFFPLEAMPEVLQALSYLVPLRYMLIIIRGIILKGVGLEPLTPQVIPLLIFGPLVLAMAARRFRKRLE